MVSVAALAVASAALPTVAVATATVASATLATRLTPPNPLTSSAGASAATASAPPATPRAVHPGAPVFHEFLDAAFRSPQGIAVGADGNFWISEVFGKQIRRMTPSGVFTTFPITDRSSQFITRGPDGNMWFTESTNFGPNPGTSPGLIGRITMSGTLTEFPVPTPFNHPYAIAAGGDGNVWFTEDGSKVGRITPSGQITEFPMPTQQGLADDITLGPDGNMWFPESLADKVTRVEPNGHMTEFDLPSGSGPEGIVTGPDGNLWIVQSGSNKIARFSLRSNSLTEFPIPTPQSDAQLIAVGPDGNLWFTEAIIFSNAQGAIGRITPDGSITEFPVPPPRRPFDEPFKIVAGPHDGKMWFTEEIGNEIVSMTIPTGVTGVTPPATVTRVRRSGHQPPPVPELNIPGNDLVAPFAMTKGSDGNVWFTERFNAAIGRIPRDGKIVEFPATEASPQSITAGPDGALWYCGVNSGVVRLTTSGAETDFPIPSGSCNYITTGADDNLWYTTGSIVGRLTPVGVATEFPINSQGPIISGPDGNMWVTDTTQFGESGVLRRISPNGTVSDFATTGFSPDYGTNPITAGPDGNIWLVGVTTAPNPSGFTSVIGRFTIASGTFTRFRAGTRLSIVNSITSGPDGNLWFDYGGNGTGPTGIIRMTTAGVIRTRMPLEAGFATPEGITIGPALVASGRGHGDQAVYVAESGIDRIAVVNLK